MSREAHVRFWEGVGVKLPRATHLVIINERHLQQVLDEYVAYFNAWRPHRGLGLRAPCGSAPPPISNAAGKIVGRPVLGGLHHVYEQAA
jgi:putative transposase